MFAAAGREAVTWPGAGIAKVTVRTMTLVPTGMAVIVVSPLQLSFGNGTESFCGVTLPSAIFAVPTAAGASCAAVMLPGVRAAAGIVGTGRGNPPVRTLKANVPLFPALSLHDPPSDDSEIRASTLTARPPGTATMCRPKPIDAVGILRGNAHERRAAAPAPHWSSKPSTVNKAALLRDVDGQIVAERLQLPAERAE